MSANDRSIVIRPSVSPSVDHVFAWNSYESLVASFCEINFCRHDAFQFMRCISERIAIGVADTRIADESETAFRSYSIDAHKIDIVF